MNKEEYGKFRFLMNISVLGAFLLVFIFVEIKQLEQKSFITMITATIVLLSIFLYLGCCTIIPEYAIYIGKTFMVFSVIMIAGVLYSISQTSLNAFSATELITTIVLFLYGYQVKSEKNKFISLKALTQP